MFFLYVHFCLPKKRTKKGSLSLNLRLPCAPRNGREFENSRSLCPFMGCLKQVFTLIPSNSCDAQRERMGSIRMVKKQMLNK